MKNLLIRLARGDGARLHGARLATREIKKDRFEGYHPTKNVEDFVKKSEGIRMKQKQC